MTDTIAAHGTVQSKEIFRHRPRRIDISIDEVRTLSIDSKRYSNVSLPGDMEDLNNRFVDIMERLLYDVHKKGIDLTGYNHDYLSQLSEIGRGVYYKLLPEEARRHIEKIEKKAAEQGRKIILNFRIPQGLPFFGEMIYTGSPFLDTDPGQFWGFRYPISRVYWEIEEEDFIYLQDGIFSAVHCKLECAGMEINEIGKLLEKLCDQLGLKLTITLLDQVIPAESLSHKQLFKFFNSEEFRYGMVHFACHHFNPEKGGASRARLCITSNEKELDISLATVLGLEEHGFYNHPLVFLNACGTTTPGHLLQSIKFPVQMFGLGAAGVIATACTIPDKFAGPFASEFYRRLFEKASTNAPLYISETLRETRQHFLEKYNNPLGLAYSLHALADQQLSLF